MCLSFPSWLVCQPSLSPMCFIFFVYIYIILQISSQASVKNGTTITDGSHYLVQWRMVSDRDGNSILDECGVCGGDGFLDNCLGNNSCLEFFLL